MKKWFAECRNNDNDIITLTTRAFTQEEAMGNLESNYHVKAVLNVQDEPLFRSPMVSYMSISLAGML